MARRGAANGSVGQRLTRQFETGTLVAEIQSALDDSGLDPTSLILEMTETTLMRDSYESALRLRALKDLGIRLAIDDFGTVYSSLAYLQRPRWTSSRSTARSMLGPAPDRASTALVHALIELGTALGLRTVAEGIETADQVIRLKQEGCDAGQGFYFSRPLA